MVSGFNARKAAQVVAYLANKAPNGRLNILKAIKLVYLADRESLRQSGFPILDDDRFSMPHGPVNSTTLRLANGELEDASWSEIIADRSNHELSVTDAGKMPKSSASTRSGKSSGIWIRLSFAIGRMIRKIYLNGKIRTEVRFPFRSGAFCKISRSRMQICTAM